MKQLVHTSTERSSIYEALKKLELLSATPRATLTHLSCSPNFPRASYLDERTLTYEPIVNCYLQSVELSCEFYYKYILSKSSLVR